MMVMDFEKVRGEFEDADLDKKIDIYVSTEGLSQTQYKELLKLFPLNELHRLEEALR